MQSSCISHNSTKGQRANYDAASCPPTDLLSRPAWLEIFVLLAACVYNDLIVVKKKKTGKKLKIYQELNTEGLVLEVCGGVILEKI